jgi:hypothetical protein
MDPYQEDAAGGVLAALVLHEHSRLLGAYHFRERLFSSTD